MKCTPYQSSVGKTAAALSRQARGAQESWPGWLDRSLQLPAYWALWEAKAAHDVPAGRAVWEAAGKAGLGK